MSEEEKRGLGLQEAVVLAVRSVQDLYKAQGYELNDVLLEEIEKTGGIWQVTVGFTRPVTATSDLGAIGQEISPRRVFKRVRIEASTGEFLGMEIRELRSTNPRR
jgi:hypothetical protein